MIVRLILAVACLSVISPARAESYRWDFHNGHFDNLSLVPAGPGAVNLLQPTRAGLRISVPAGHDVKTVGFSPRFRIHGDFEIAIEFTILNRTKPKAGYGTGPSLYLSMGSTSDPAASLGRQLRPDGRDVYGAFAARVEEGKRIPTARLFDAPRAATSITGRLQLRRTGAEVTYSAADNNYSPPQPLVTLPVSDADVTMVRIGLNQSDPQSAAVIVLHNLRIEAEALPQLPTEQSRTAQLYRPRYQSPPPPRSSRWLWQSLTALLLTTLLSLWLWHRRRSS